MNQYNKGKSGEKMVNKKINTLRNTMIERYLNKNVDELLRDLSIEEDAVRGYHGREILELLQNIDDAIELSRQENKQFISGEAEVSFIDGILRVANTGSTFIYDGIESIVLGHVSTKDKSLIGSKGSGFRGLLNWSTNIKIYSGEFNIGFSKEFADGEYQKLREHESIKRQERKSARRGGNPPTFPIFSMPKAIDEIEKGKYSTIIEIKIDEENNKDDYNVINQLNNFDYRTLLFLPNLSKITLIVEDEVKTFSKKTLVNGAIDKVVLTSNFGTEETFYLMKKELENKEPNKHIIIAAPLFEMDNFPIYSYFPTKQQFPFPILVHAPFHLTQDRNRIATDKDGENKKMLSNIIERMIEFSVTLTKTQENKELPLFFLTPNKFEKNIRGWGFGYGSTIGDFYLEDYFLDKICDAELYPLRNGGYTKLINGIKTFDIPTPQSFRGGGFNLLLENINNPKVSHFVRKLIGRKGISTYFSAYELIKIINEKELNIHERVEVFIWWSEQFPNNYNLPNLIEIDGEFVSSKTSNRVFLPSADGISDLPDKIKKHIKLKIIDQNFIDLLIAKIKNNEIWKEVASEYVNPSDKRILDRYSERKLFIRFIEQSSREMIIREINNQINAQDVAIEFTMWLFKLYKRGDLTSQGIKEINFNFPVVTGTKKANEIYLGKNWRNDIGDKLFNQEKYEELITPTAFGLTEDDYELFVTFITEFGVSKYPRFSVRPVSGNEFKTRIGFVQQRYIYSATCDDFSNLITNLETETILEWIEKDEYLHSIIPAIEKNSYAQLRRNSHPMMFHTNAYILYILNTTKWISINGTKYSPENIVFFDRLSNNVDSYLGISRTQIKKLLGDLLYINLNFRKTFADFEDDELSDIIKKLSQINDKKVSPKLYDDVVRGKSEKTPISSNYSTEDFSVLCDDGEYYPSKLVRYADKIVPRIYKNNPDNHFIQIPPKRGIKTIKDWLGVERFEVELKYKSHTLFESSNLDAEINDIKISLLSSIDNNKDNIENMKRITIVPCSKLTVVDEFENTFIIDDEYYHISKDNYTVYLKMPSDYDPIKLGSLLRDIFSSILNLNIDEKLVQLLLGMNKNRKQEYVSSAFGLQSWSNAEEELSFGKKDTKQVILAFFKEEGLSKNLLDKLNKINFSTYLDNAEIAIVIESLRELKKDVFHVNNLNIFPQVNVIPYFEKQLEEYKNKNFELFEKKLFVSLKDRTINEQKRFIDLLKEFSDYTFDFKNTVNFDVENEMKLSFPIMSMKTTDINVGEIYALNYKLITNEDPEFDDFITSNNYLKSLVYFYSEAVKKYIEIEFENTKISPLTEIVSISDDYSDGIIVNEAVKAIPPKQKKTKRSTTKTGKTRTQRKRENQLRDKAGKEAEEFAYEKLLTRYSTLKWTSENAHAHLPERNTSTSNDMHYINSKGEKILIEIKSSTGTFFMTASEYNLAVELGTSYELWLVDNSKKKINGPKFIKDFEPSKEATEYKFTFE